MSERGSERLLEAWRNGPGIDERIIQRIVDATRDLEIQDVLIKGQPHPEVFRAVGKTDDAGRLGAMVTAVLAGGVEPGFGLPVVRCFPHGLTEPDVFFFDITVGRAPAGF